MSRERKYTVNLFLCILGIYVTGNSRFQAILELPSEIKFLVNSRNWLKFCQALELPDNNYLKY